MDSDLYLALVEDNNDVFKGKDWHKVRDQLTTANNTVLHLACQHGSKGCVNEILGARESLLLLINSRGETALHLAARQGHYGAVEALLNKAKALDREPNNLESTSSTVLQNLIRAPDMEFETALHAAVRFNHDKVVELLVKEDPSYSYPPNKYDETPLYLASVRCWRNVPDVILDNCKSPTYGGPDGRTALHAALMEDFGYGCVKFLLEKNNDLIKVADNNGWTAFHYVANNNLNDCVEYLMEVDKSVAYLADKNYKRTPIHVAANKGHHMVLGKLLMYLPDAWESVDGNGQNILHIAITQGHGNLISFIFSSELLNHTKDALLNQRDKDGNTPLHLVAKFGFYFPELKELYRSADRNAVWDVDWINPDWIVHDPNADRIVHDQNADGNVVNDTNFYLDLTKIIITNFTLDWNAVNNTNFTPQDVFHQRQTGTQGHEVLVDVIVDRAGVRRPWDLWIEDKAREEIKEEEKQDGLLHTQEEKLKSKRYREVMNTHMIVAALITTVALTAGFAVPGGFDGNQGPNQGSAVLLRKTSFKTFMIADSIALLFSISSLFLYFMTQFNMRERVLLSSLAAATAFNVVSIISMTLAFIAGTSAVLSHSSGLTTTVCVISSLFLLLVIYVCFRVFRWFSKSISKDNEAHQPSCLRIVAIALNPTEICG